MTQREIIIEVLKDAKGEWVPSYDIIKTDTKYGWLGTSADRIARYMLDRNRSEYDPFLERKEEGKYAYYRYQEPKKEYRPEYEWETYKKHKVLNQNQGALI